MRKDTKTTFLHLLCITCIGVIIKLLRVYIKMYRFL